MKLLISRWRIVQVEGVQRVSIGRRVRTVTGESRHRTIGFTSTTLVVAVLIALILGAVAYAAAVRGAALLATQDTGLTSGGPSLGATSTAVLPTAVTSLGGASWMEPSPRGPLATPTPAPAVTPSPQATPRARATPTAKRTEKPSHSYAVSGTATWYCRAGVSRCTAGYPDRAGIADLYAAAGPALRVGSWRGRLVTVWRGSLHVRVRLIDSCGSCSTAQAIDLYADAMARLGGLSRGRISVTVRW